MSFHTIRMFPVAMLAAALAALLALTAAPAVAQTTVTSNGREGPMACLSGQTEDNAGNMPITALSTTSIGYTTPTITWNEYVGRIGDTPAPIHINFNATVYDAKTKAQVNTILLANVISGNSYSGRTTSNRSGLSAKKSYYLEFYVSPSGSIPKQVFARRCFMTGGTYTISANPIASGPTQGSTGCFTISPLTQQDVRNCWCGRKTTLPLFSSTQDNTNWLNRWGCR